MAGKRRVFGPAFKAKVALAAAKGDRTTAQLASQFGIRTIQVTAWKKQLMAQVAELFADGRQGRADQATDEQELYEQIGRLKMEVEWLKKKLPRSADVKRRCIDPNHKHLSVARQCQLIGLARSSRSNEPHGESAENLGPDAGDRPPVHQAAVLRDAEGPRTLRHQSEEGSAAHASARPRGARRGVGQSSPRDLQHGPRSSVHGDGLHEPIGKEWRGHLDGWSRPSPRQRVRRKALTHGQV